jgi:hypothetical protein
LKRETDRELRALPISAEISLRKISDWAIAFLQCVGALRYVNVALLMETHPREQRRRWVPWAKAVASRFHQATRYVATDFAKAAGVVRPVGHLHWLTDRSAAP